LFCTLSMYRRLSRRLHLVCLLKTYIVLVLVDEVFTCPLGRALFVLHAHYEQRLSFEKGLNVSLLKGGHLSCENKVHLPFEKGAYLSCERGKVYC